MGNIELLSEPDRRPVVVCAACKKSNVVDIRGFQNDMTRLAKVRCIGCNRWLYMGIILLANLSQEGLLGNIELICKTVNAKETLRVGEKGTAQGNLLS